MKTTSAFIGFNTLSVASALLTLTPTAPCESFAKNVSLSAYGATILNTTYHGVHTVNVTDYYSKQVYNTFAFCQIDGVVSYGSNSSTHFSLWLPDSIPYNGRFMAVGNGGMAGTIDQVALMTNLNSGFAVAGGDAGHLASLNNQGSGAPDTYISYLHNRDQVTAWIHDAIALFTPAARAVVKGYYGKEASHSYYDGCSTGGAQGFALAQYHPDLFDGIIAGSPGNWYSHLALSFLWNAQRTQSNSSFLSQAALNLTTAAVLKACDALDGVADGVVENPLLCDFQLSTLACNSSAVANNSTCLTPDQIEAAKAIYAGPTNAETGAQLYPGFSPGSEIEWILQEGDLASAFAVPILQNLVYNDLNYNPSTFDWAGDVKDVDEKAGAFIDEISVNLTAFRNRGGKMIVTQGWADPFNAATWPIEHMERIQTFFGGDISDFFNLFMIPGGGHCGAASYFPSVPATYHTITRLVEWVERSDQPRDVLSTHPPDGSTRSHKLCPWPQTAVYVQGDVDDWNSYVCEG